ncbi:WD40/YVTN/BNR-like repeat-containing protein [Neptunitalea lumnitzerae]|nr:oxidoreductase [Neptunitalea sp. Y10]
MRKFSVLVAILLAMVGCNKKEIPLHNFKEVAITPVYTDAVSIRTLELMNDGATVAFAGDGGVFGTFNTNTGKVRGNEIEYVGVQPEFRATAHTKNDFFMISVGNPALLYKTGKQGKMELVYTEVHENVFYDSMKFWNDMEGIAVGDATDGCASIIITRDGGNTWEKLACDIVPEIKDKEAFFAASNTNIVVYGNETWIASGGARSAILYSPDKGASWELFETPFVSGKESSGIFSIDFYDRMHGFAVGGDYVDTRLDENNKAVTEDGGRTWKIVANNDGVGYKSCVQYVPNGNANELVAVGRTGISYSKNAGQNWKKLSDEPFYTFRFLNDSVAYAAGNAIIAKLTFKK